MKIPSENNSTKFPRASTANELSRAMDGLQLGWFICCKTKLKKKIFFLKNMFFTKYTLFAEKMFLYGKKKFYIEFFFTEKKTFFTEKNINENVKIYISFEKYILMQNMFVLQIKYKSFLNICSF